MACEQRAGFEVPTSVSVACARMAGAVDDQLAIDLDELADEVLRDVLRSTQRQLDRLTAFRSKATSVLQSRLVRQAGPGREQRGIRDTRHFLTGELNLAPSEAKKTEQTGSRLRQAPATRDAFGAGDLGQEHAKVITDMLRLLAPGDQRDELEGKLVVAAATQDPVALGRTARRLLAETDYEAAVTNERRRHNRRFWRLTQVADGEVRMSASLFGVQAERAMTAYHAFQIPDAAGDHPRSPEQRAADALDEIFDAALRSGEAPAVHGVRPHVEVVVEYSDLARSAGIAELAYTGPITIDHIRPLLVDSTISRVIVGPDSMPLEVGKKTRHVPAALWTALKFRDKGCAWHGCTAPPGWCEVAHVGKPYRFGGKLSLSNAVLLCKRHHAIYDNTDWICRIDGPNVTFVPP